MAPEDWHATRLGEIFINRRERGREGLPTLSVTMNDGLVDRNSLDRKMDTNLLAEEHLAVRPGDIAYNMMRMWQGACGLADQEALVSPAYVVLQPTSEIFPEYAAYLFKTPRMIHSFWAYSYGLTNDRLRLYFRDFSAIRVYLPSLDEQKTIVAILSTWDRAIHTTERLIATIQTQKRALMQQLLTGKKRLPGFAGEWKTVELNSIAKIVMGSSPQSEHYNNEGLGLPLLQGNADITRGRSSPRLFTSEITQECRPGDTLLSVRAPVGSVAICDHHACLGRGLAAIRTNEGTSHELIHQLLVSIENNWKGLSQGSTFESINRKDVKELRFTIPSDFDEQETIARVLSDSDRELNLAEELLRQIQTEKAGLAQQLLTGKRRIPVTITAKERASA